MKCRFESCPQPTTLRDCVVCFGPAHHVCSNEFLFLHVIELEDGAVFCSSECYGAYSSCEYSCDYGDKDASDEDASGAHDNASATLPASLSSESQSAKKK